MEELLSISEVCERVGVSARTVRYYEELGLLPGVRRKNGGRRAYGADEIERLRFIGRLKKLGLSLEEIGELNAVYTMAGSTREMLGRLRGVLRQRLGDLDRRIDELAHLREDMSRYLTRVEKRIDERPERNRNDDVARAS